ncbi:phage tail protein [Lentzea guizhouensis]|uniref:Phage tail protein n=1 Tax=Lentzea guizhouensis TaxID=1586287 RepID=A0A1B2HMC6_9PSEU|nr:phage tail protein [Lentzea guizhouensis]ANZ38869.1 phage tail protein [Lentzea guizhouensis]
MPISPHPLGERLPAVYTDDDFTQRFTAALDEVLAPVFTVLDCFAAYLDPRLAPAGFADWLAGWVALDLDESWTASQRRELVARAVHLHRFRGTRRGLAEHVWLLTGGRVEIADSGGTAVSPRPDGALPGSSPAHVLIRIRLADPHAVDRARITAAVRRMVPAHVATTIEVVT